jgi:hypothetical protein
MHQAEPDTEAIVKVKGTALILSLVLGLLAVPFAAGPRSRRHDPIFSANCCSLNKQTEANQWQRRSMI